jgi:hypothetical protein
MQSAGISGLQARKRGRTTVRVQGVRVADDLVKRQFRPDAPDVLWLADFSYLRTWEGWLYLAAVQDAFSRRIVGWCMADHMREELVIDALTMELRDRVALGAGCLIAALGGHRCVGVAGGDDAGTKGDGRAGDAVWVASAVPALVACAHEPGDGPQGRGSVEYPLDAGTGAREWRLTNSGRNAR